MTIITKITMIPNYYNNNNYNDNNNNVKYDDDHNNIILCLPWNWKIFFSNVGDVDDEEEAKAKANRRKER